jgi:hypothetical protein
MRSARWQRAWAASGVLCVVLFGCGLFFADVLAPGYPALDDSFEDTAGYFDENEVEVRALGFFHVLAAIALLFFATYVGAFIRRTASESGGLAALAVAGGATAAGFLLLSALLFRALAEPEVSGDEGTQHAVLVLSYLAGGPAITVPLAPMIGACSVVVLRYGGLPAWIGWLGLAAAAVCLASAAMLLGPAENTAPLFGLLLLAAGFGFLWLLSASAAMAIRLRHAPPSAGPGPNAREG